jgi:hypothetical protein
LQRILLSSFGFLATASLAFAQLPTVGEINVYGAHKVPAARILAAAKLTRGQPMPASKGDLEDRIAQIPGVLRAHVEAVCCEGRNAVLFVGVEEREATRVPFRAEPSGAAALPPGLDAQYREFLSALSKGQGNASAAAALEEKFAANASAHLPELREVLRASSDGDARAIAAAVIGYAPEKAAIVPDLQYALLDPDESVRSNALRSLHSLTLAADGVQVSKTAVVDLLNSSVLSDRMGAADFLVTVTDKPDSAVIALMRARALAALVEMARWESLRYALRPFLLVGRIAGLSEDEIQQRWSSGERELVIQKALATSRPSSAAPPAPPKK